MKRYSSCILILLLILSITGCKTSPEQTSQNTKKFDIKKAEAIVNTYMRGLADEDYEGIKKLYTDELLKTTTPMVATDLKVKGYNITEINQVGETGMFKVRVSRTNLDKSASSLDEYTLKVVLDNWNYKISKVQNSIQKEAYFENYGLRIRNDDQVKTNLLIDEDGIPQYGFSADDKAQVTKLDVPRKNFGSINFSYSGDMIGVSTYSTNTYVSIVKIDESMTVQGGGDQGGGQGGAGQGGQGGPTGGGQGGTTGPREKPIGKEIMSLDILKDSKVNFMLFSPDEKFLLVQYTRGDNTKCLRMYTTEKGELTPFKFEDNFNTNNVDINFMYFDKDTLNFQVVPKDNKKDIEKQVTGTWQLDLKKFKAKKV